MTDREHNPLRQSLGQFYSAIGATTRTAAAVVNAPTKGNARALRSSLLDALRSVDQLAAAIETTPDQTPRPNKRGNAT